MLHIVSPEYHYRECKLARGLLTNSAQSRKLLANTKQHAYMGGQYQSARTNINRPHAVQVFKAAFLSFDKLPRMATSTANSRLCCAFGSCKAHLLIEVGLTAEHPRACAGSRPSTLMTLARGGRNSPLRHHENINLRPCGPH